MSSMQEGSTNEKITILHSHTLTIFPILPHWSSTKGTSCHSYTTNGSHRPHNLHRLIGGYAGYVVKSRPLLTAAPFAGKWGPKWSSYSQFPLVGGCRSPPLWPPTQLPWPPMGHITTELMLLTQTLVTAVHHAAVPDFPFSHFASVERVGFNYAGPDLVWVMSDLTH